MVIRIYFQTDMFLISGIMESSLPFHFGNVWQNSASMFSYASFFINFMAMISLSILFLFSLSTFLAMWSFLPFISWLIIDSGAPWNKKEYQRQSAQLSNKSMMKIPNYVNIKCCVFIIKNKIWLTRYYYRSFYSISKERLSNHNTKNQNEICCETIIFLTNIYFQFCEENGGMLVEPRRNKETRKINKMINKLAGDKSYWTGMLTQICQVHS